MYTFAALALLVASAQASVYVTNPVQTTTCTGGQSCLVQWTDDGQNPLLSAIGDCTVAVYTGDYVLVQSLPAVNVATSTSFTFTPDPAVAANGQFYIVFTSTDIEYSGYSATFNLNGMTGTTPSGGSSTPGPTTTPASSSTPSGSSTPGTTPTDTNTASTPSGTSTPTASTTTPTGFSSTPGTTPTSTPSATPTLTTPTLSSSPTSSHTPTSSSPSTSATSTPSASPTSGAARIGSSLSLGGIAALFALTGALVF